MKLLIWDFDGTLGYRDGGAWTASLLEVLRAAQPFHPATLEDLQPYTASGFRWLAPERAYTPVAPGDAASVDGWWAELLPLFERAYAGIGLPEGEARRLARRFRATYLNPARWRAFDDAAPALRALAARGWTHALLSNHVPELPELARVVGLAPYFARIFNSAELGYEKPHPQTFAQVLAAFPDAERVWMIGDSYRADVLGAEAAGIPAILVRRSHPGARYAVGDLRQLPMLIA